MLKTLVIKFFPATFVKILRLYRPCLEYFKFVSYKCGLNRSSFYPYYLKVVSRRKSGFLPVCRGKDKLACWGRAFCAYNNVVGRRVVPVMWADGPVPGNYGDWLSPYIINKALNVNVVHVDEVLPGRRPHLVALGSIAASAGEQSVVVGAGVTSKKDMLNISASFISLRGPYSDKIYRELGGSACGRYGDIGFLMRRLYEPKLGEKKEPYLLVRHICHANVNIDLPDGFREISIFRAHPDDIEEFVDELHTAEVVVTSAMHCFITCISYSIPCVLVTFGDWRKAVPGDGIKYRDALAGVGLEEVEPIAIERASDLLEVVAGVEVYRKEVSESALDEIETSLKLAAELV